MKAQQTGHELPVETELRELETCLETPFVPGDLERWMEAVVASWQRLAPAFRERFEHEQPHLFEQIAADDPELLERVAELREHNDQVLGRHRDLDRRIADSARRVPQIEPDEKRLDDELSRLVADGLAFIIEARKQEIATRTWMLEAYGRETGPVD